MAELVLVVRFLSWQPLLPYVHALFWLRALVSRRTCCGLRIRKNGRCVSSCHRRRHGLCRGDDALFLQEGESKELTRRACVAMLCGCLCGAFGRQYTTRTCSPSPSRQDFVYLCFTAGVAQLVEPQIVTLVVAGSSPVTRPYSKRHGTRCRGVCRFVPW